MSWYLKFILLVLIFPLGIYFVVRDAKRGSEKKKIFDESPEGQKILREKAAIKAEEEAATEAPTEAEEEAATEAPTEAPTEAEKEAKSRRIQIRKQIDILNNENCKGCLRPRKGTWKLKKCVCPLSDVNLEEMFDLYNQVQIPILDDKWTNHVANKYGTYIFVDKVKLYAQFLIEMKQGNKEPTSDNFDNWLTWGYLEKLEIEYQRKLLLDSITDISGVSDKIARTILDQYPTIESIKSATKEELIEIPGVGKVLAVAIKARIG